MLLCVVVLLVGNKQGVLPISAASVMLIAFLCGVTAEKKPSTIVSVSAAPPLFLPHDAKCNICYSRDCVACW